MKPFFYCLILIMCYACGKDKIVQLPEIKHANISKINDVSPAYLFYDVTQPDSVELNRKNLISTTNWLINVDKRLTLGQAIPKIVFLQDKKRHATMHKNENAKNFFTCNDLSKHTLGFVDFTDVVYHIESSNEYFNKKNPKINFDQYISLKIKSADSILIDFFTNGCNLIQTSNQLNLIKHVKGNLINTGNAFIVLEFSKNLSFQDYMTIKHVLSKLDLKNVTIAHDEFVFN